MKKLAYYFRIWWLMSKNSFVAVLYSKLALFIFLTGKLIRFSFFLVFLFFLVKGTNSLAGYNFQQAAFFFLTYNFIDVVAQFLFREVYRFRPLIVTGDFDLVLVKPVNPLFRVLLGGADIIDLITIPPLVWGLIYVACGFNPNFTQVALYILLVFNGLLIATAFYIFVLAFGIITFEIDNVVMIYRDVSSLGRLPIDIYREPMHFIITYLIPIGIMVSFPVKALMGLINPWGVILSFFLGVGLILVAIRVWDLSLKRYSSASS